MFYVTEERAGLLVAQLKVWNTQIAVMRRNPDLIRSDGDSSGMLTSQTSNELEVLMKQAADLDKAIIAFQLVKPTAQTNIVSIGNVITLEVEGEPTKRTLLVGGYGDEDGKATPYPIVTYMAPLVLPFFGKRAGFETQVQVRNKPCWVSLEKIALPPPDFKLVKTAA